MDTLHKRPGGDVKTAWRTAHNHDLPTGTPAQQQQQQQRPVDAWPAKQASGAATPGHVEQPRTSPTKAFGKETTSMETKPIAQPTTIAFPSNKASTAAASSKNNSANPPPFADPEDVTVGLDLPANRSLPAVWGWDVDFC
jgi:hypothetical protein